jgi:centrosomal protein CEP70
MDADSDAPPPRFALLGIVQHFMNLFDVARITGCYARMNDIYTKLGEVHNIMKALKNLLGLGEC